MRANGLRLGDVGLAHARQSERDAAGALKITGPPFGGSISTIRPLFVFPYLSSLQRMRTDPTDRIKFLLDPLLIRFYATSILFRASKQIAEK